MGSALFNVVSAVALESVLLDLTKLDQGLWRILGLDWGRDSDSFAMISPHLRVSTCFQALDTLRELHESNLL